MSDPDVWVRLSVKPGGFLYCQYVLFYVDGVLCIIGDPICTMKGIQAKFKLKGYKIQEPDMQLVAYLSNINNSDGRECWAMSSDKYGTTAVKNV